MKKAIANWLNDHIAAFLQFVYALFIVGSLYAGLVYCALYLV